MKNYTIKRYQTTDYSNWNTFIAKSKNGNFLFNRDFMDYHSDRFSDYSLIVLEDQKWIAVLPANIYENQLFSHQGLTFGGLIYDEKQKIVNIIEAFKQISEYLFNEKIKTLHLKTIPSIYHQKPAEELSYILFLMEAKLTRRDCLSVIDLSQKINISSGRMEGVNKGEKNNLLIKEVEDFEDFWEQILVPNLQDKHQAKPVHTLQEITKLKQFFPKNIRQFNVYQDNKIVAGTTIFESKNVAHAQYISGNKTKSENGSLDFLYHYLITDIFKNKQFFDFGTSNELQGKKLNSGLLFWKESFGANTIVHDFYEIETKNFSKLEDVLK